MIRSLRKPASRLGEPEMCYGSLDPKYMLHPVPERMKGVAFVADKSEEPGQMPAGGLSVWLRNFFRRMKRKDLVNG